MKYKGYTRRNIDIIEQLKNFPEKILEEMKIVANVLPFKANNYVINELINWDNIPNDPIFQLTFPHRGMLLPWHFHKMQTALEQTSKQNKILEVANQIRHDLNPSPAGQRKYNIPLLDEEELHGIQHKYKETVLFFPKPGQTCHAFCSFCFRWPQFTKLKEEKFESKNIDKLIEYLHINPDVTDVLFTGGDPMIMSTKLINRYMRPLIEAGIPSLKSIRIGSKSLSYWPYRFTTDKDSGSLLQLFEETVDSGLNLSFMAHINHYNELKTEVLKTAVSRILRTGTQIRTQSPILKHINADPMIWAKMWQMQVNLGMTPYYMFIVRDTGARHYFNITLKNAWEIYSDAYRKVSGLCKTVRGPSMSCTPGKIEVMGISEIQNQQVFVLRFIQARNPQWVNEPFFARYNPDAVWIDDLEPAFSDQFIHETGSEDESISTSGLENYSEEGTTN